MLFLGNVRANRRPAGRFTTRLLRELAWMAFSLRTIALPIRSFMDFALKSFPYRSDDTCPHGGDLEKHSKCHRQARENFAVAMLSSNLYLSAKRGTNSI
jgi:hypothetical protein